MKSNIEWLRLQIWLAEWRIMVVNKVNSAAGRAYERYYPRLGWQLVEKLSIAATVMLDALWYQYATNINLLKKLTVPISEAERLNSLPLGMHSPDTEYKKLTTFFVDDELRVLRAQLSWMFNLKHW